MQTMTAPLIAQAVGIAAGGVTLVPNTNRRMPWGRVVFDTAGQSGLVVTLPNGNPSGNIFLRYPGYWNINGQIYVNPPQTTPVSLFVGIYDLGTDGTQHLGPLYSSNQFVPVGEHPDLRFNFDIQVTDAGGRYFAVEVYYLTGNGQPPSQTLVAGDNYNSLQVQLLGPLS
jgi:hypothetical protein